MTHLSNSRRMGSSILIRRPHLMIQFFGRPDHAMNHRKENKKRETQNTVWSFIQYSWATIGKHMIARFLFFGTVSRATLSTQKKKAKWEGEEGKERKIEDLGFFAPDFRSSHLNLLSSVLGQCLKAASCLLSGRWSQSISSELHPLERLINFIRTYPKPDFFLDFSSCFSCSHFHDTLNCVSMIRVD